ncbi:FtsX-like permease family protein [Antrihabitans cavernicola]|uniref:FtsX-like permease family protein n=1 Tax=Antrihabitans cavernicola TaxID=2495913 RepID=A0A5A7SA99_9NOCA|nr:FtsX-like permease family protein [Spelaeibacter cavernicola]KAA0022846.1 FtsX-like permease family protein [Spelaeibacter cavernicola]
MIPAALDRLRIFNLREFATHRARTLMSLAVVAVSAALLVAVLGITGSITGSVDRLTTAIGGNADLEVSGITDGGFDQSLLDKVGTVSGVDAAVPMLRMTLGSATNRTLLIGTDQRGTALHTPMQNAVAHDVGALLSVPNGVLVGTGTGHAKGDVFELGSKSVTVAAVVTGADADTVNGGHFVLAPLTLAQQITDRAGRLDSVLLTTKPGADVTTVRSAVSNAVAGRAIVATPSFRAAQAGAGIAVLRYSTLLAASAALVVTMFLIYNTMSMALSQRRPAISLLRALGGQRRAILRDVLAEAAVLGLLGSAVGAALGIMLGRSAIRQLPEAIVQSVDTRTEFILPGYAVPAAMAVCVCACVAAAALAGQQVYRVAPIEALVPVAASRSALPSRSLLAIAAACGLILAGGAVAVATSDLGKASVGSIGLSLLAALALCFALTGPIIALVAAAARLFGAPGTLAATTIERAPRRVWATLMTVLIAVTVTVTINNSNNDVIDSTTDSFAGLAKTDIWVSSTSAAVFPTSPILAADVLPAVRSAPGVSKVVAGQMAFATLGSDRVMIQGLQSGANGPIYSSLDPAVRERLREGTGIVLSRDVARSLGVSTGGAVDLPTPNGSQHLTVLAVVPFFAAISGTAAIDFDRMQQWFDRPGSTVLQVMVAPGADAARVQAAIRAAVPDNVYVFSGSEAVAGVSGAIAQATALTGAITWIVVLVAAIALLNTLMLSVLERRRELGVLRAMGSSRRFALRTVLAEAVAIGVIGAVLGLAIGAATQVLNARAITDVLSIDVAYHPRVLMVVFAGAALLLSLLGSIPPAIRAARLNVVDAIGTE